MLSEIAPWSAPGTSLHNRHPQPPIRHPDLETVARNLSDKPGARPGLTEIVGPRLPHGPARLLVALISEPLHQKVGVRQVERITALSSSSLRANRAEKRSERVQRYLQGT
jgi:hypothetical protein